MSASPLRCLAWVFAMACSSVPSLPPVYAADAVLRVAGEREKAWTQSRTPLVLSSGQASNCNSYSQLKASGLVDDGHNHLVKSEYLICDVLAQLDKSAKFEALPATNYGAELASRLDLRSFRSSLRPMIDDERYTLSSLFDGEVQLEHDAAVVKDEDVSFALKVVVVGDLDRNGILDWLVWVSDEAPAGTYRDYQTLLIKDVAPQGLLRAESL